MVAIGIDLGTTYSCVAVYRNGKVEVIPNEIGKKTTPSHVAFDDSGGVLIGEQAKFRADVNPKNSIFDVKRLIGRRFDDPIVQKDIKYWPFNVVQGQRNTPVIRLTNEKEYLAEQISARVLSKLKENAEAYLGSDVTDAVITVPAYFNDGQRQATRDAGEIAGMNVLRIINEPTAAAIAYNFQRRSEELKTILVFDLGGGTFDISILTMQGSDIEVKAVGGDCHLGGEDFDNTLLQHCIRTFQQQHNIDLEAAKNSTSERERMLVSKRLRRLKNECEQEKVHLSAAKNTVVCLDAIYQDISMEVRVTRDTLNDLNKEAFDRCIEIMDQTIKEAGLTNKSIDEVVLVGGSSKIPAIQERIKDYFDGRTPLQTIRGDEAVAYGAALQASLMAPAAVRPGFDPLPEIQFKDVYPLPVGIKIRTERDGTNFNSILTRNVRIPCEKLAHYETVEANQRVVSIKIYEGLNPTIETNHFLGEFAVDMPPGCPKGEPIDVTMAINEEGILHCSAMCPKNFATNQLRVMETKGRLTKEDIIKMFEELHFNTIYN